MSVKVDIAHVASLSDQQLEDVASVSSRAYLDACSPAISLLTGGKLELLPDLFRSMTRACLLDGECYVATEITTQRIVGTALWFPPGKHLWATDEVRGKSGFNTFHGQLSDAAKDWWLNEYDPQLTAFLKEYYGPETSLGSWWLNNVAVLPEYQGNGIGASLCEVVLNKATANETVGCCTDTEKNAKFYKYLRFEEVGIFYMSHPVDGSEIKVWALKRKGSAQAA